MIDVTQDNNLLQPEGRGLSTLEADGSRRWIHPRLSRGRFLLARRMLGYRLIAFAILLGPQTPPATGGGSR